MAERARGQEAHRAGLPGAQRGLDHRLWPRHGTRTPSLASARLSGPAGKSPDPLPLLWHVCVCRVACAAVMNIVYWQATQVYKQFGDFEYMALALGISLPFLFVPLLFPSAAEKNTPITERYFFKVPPWHAPTLEGDESLTVCGVRCPVCARAGECVDLAVWFRRELLLDALLLQGAGCLLLLPGHHHAQRRTTINPSGAPFSSLVCGVLTSDLKKTCCARCPSSST